MLFLGLGRTSNTKLYETSNLRSWRFGTELRERFFQTLFNCFTTSLSLFCFIHSRRSFLTHSHPFETPPKISQPVNCPDTISHTRALGPELNQNCHQRGHTCGQPPYQGNPPPLPRFVGQLCFFQQLQHLITTPRCNAWSSLEQSEIAFANVLANTSAGLIKPTTRSKRNETQGHHVALIGLPASCTFLLSLLLENYFRNVTTSNTSDGSLFCRIRTTTSIDYLDTYNQRHTTCILQWSHFRRLWILQSLRLYKGKDWVFCR